MKVLLVNPPYHEVYSKVSTAEGVTPPLGLAYIASYLRSNDIDVEILDANALQININALYNLSTKFRSFDIVAVPSFTPSINKSVKVLEIAKKINPECVTVMGGSHITAIPVETMEAYPVIDFAVLGEGEKTFLELVRALDENRNPSEVDGIAYRMNGGIKLTKSRKLIENLDELPFPAYDLLPMNKYRIPLHHVGFGKNVPLKPFAVVFTSRGCPFNCTYCASKVIWGRQVRFRSPENVLDEIDYLVTKYKLRVLDVADDIFTINNKRANAILDGLIERKYDLHFNCLSRVDTINRDLLEKMKKAGCYLIRFGVESGSQKILDRMKKQVKISKIKEAFKLTKEVGIPATASFMLGHPGETQQTAQETINIAKEIDPYLAHFFITIPLVGTEVYEIAKRDNLIVDRDWSYWVQMTSAPVLRTEELSPEDLVKLRKKAYMSFYFRVSFLISCIRRIKHPSQVTGYLKGIFAVRSLIK